MDVNLVIKAKWGLLINLSFSRDEEKSVSISLETAYMLWCNHSNNHICAPECLELIHSPPIPLQLMG